MASVFEMRVGDAERDAAAAELREHFASGRLTQDELIERLDQAFAARTRGDLHALMTDLPGPAGWPWAAHPGSAGSGSAGSGSAGSGSAGSGSAGSGSAGYGRRRRGRRMAGTLVVSLFMLWALLVLGIMGAFGIGSGRPLSIVLIIAALALFRRLVFGIFRRRRGGGRGSRRWC